MITTPNRKKRSRSEQARINQRAKESQTHLQARSHNEANEAVASPKISKKNLPQMKNS